MLITTLARRLLPLVLLALLLPAPPPAARGAPARQPPSQAAFPRLTDPVPDPQQSGVLWFAATGHTLRGAFRDYWTRYGGLAQFGYPLTEEFRIPLGPANHLVTVQYFQRDRFEQHPENAGTPYEVLLGALGRAFHAPDPPAPRLPDPLARYFPATGHNLSGLFQQYWEAHGGLYVHGYPLTEPFSEVNPVDGRAYVVQYFERSRFEWHPEHAGTPYEVLLGLLGTQLAGQQGYFAGRYPLFGHAADFSWVAGVMRLYQLNCGGAMTCGCSILQYDGQVAAFQLNFPGAEPSPYGQRGVMHEGTKLVFFGRPAHPDEPGYVCPADNEPIYFVDMAQVNPLP